MINERSAKDYCSEDPSLIENYQEAISDKNEVWDLHHRREIDEGLSGRELMKRKEYFHRPACELIFLKHDEHSRLHGLNLSEETRKKLSQAHSGEKCYLFGKHLSVETREKLSQALLGNKNMLGKHLSDETRKKMSQAQLGNTNVRGYHWYNNGVKSVRAKSCPEGFVGGRLPF